MRYYIVSIVCSTTCFELHPINTPCYQLNRINIMWYELHCIWYHMLRTEWYGSHSAWIEYLWIDKLIDYRWLMALASWPREGPNPPPTPPLAAALGPGPGPSVDHEDGPWAMSHDPYIIDCSPIDYYYFIYSRPFISPIFCFSMFWNWRTHSLNNHKNQKDRHQKIM